MGEGWARVAQASLISLIAKHDTVSEAVIFLKALPVTNYTNDEREECGDL